MECLVHHFIFVPLRLKKFQKLFNNKFRTKNYVESL
jgi:hypothetical protein